MVVADEVSRCAMEAANGIKEEGTEVKPTAIPDPPKTSGVEATRTDKGNPPRNVGTMARKATWRASARGSVPIRRKLDPDPINPKKEIGSNRTMPKDPKNSERGQPS